MKIYNNIILVGGTGRNVGKTTFVCKLINKFKDQNVIGLKICPYMHDIERAENLLLSDENFQILRETNMDGKKDSSKMLMNGAKEVYYIQAVDEGILTAFNFLMEKFIGNHPVICESASLRKYIQPDINFCVTSNDENLENKKSCDFNFDCIVTNERNDFDFNFDRLELVENKWVLS